MVDLPDQVESKIMGWRQMGRSRENVDYVKVEVGTGRANKKRAQPEK